MIHHYFITIPWWMNGRWVYKRIMSDSSSTWALGVWTPTPNPLTYLLDEFVRWRTAAARVATDNACRAACARVRGETLLVAARRNAVPSGSVMMFVLLPDRWMDVCGHRVDGLRLPVVPVLPARGLPWLATWRHSFAFYLSLHYPFLLDRW